MISQISTMSENLIMVLSYNGLLSLPVEQKMGVRFPLGPPTKFVSSELAQRLADTQRQLQMYWVESGDFDKFVLVTK